ncbi:hypothetical protein [Dolichospermum phage Dfl-JY45]
MKTVKSLVASIKTYGLGAVIFAAAMSQASAQRDVADIAQSVDETGGALGSAAWTMIALVGFVTTGVGVFKMIKAKENREGMGMGLGMTIGGAVMAALPFLIGAFSQTGFGEGASGLDRINVD